MKTVIFASITLMGGAIIYILFRPTYLIMFKWIDSFGLMKLINSIRLNSEDLPDWVLYSLPDGLWMFSYCLFIGQIWNYNIKKCLLFLSILPIYAVSNEIMQYFHLVSGTFDWMDLLAFLIAFTLSVLYIKRFKVEVDRNESLNITN